MLNKMVVSKFYWISLGKGGIRRSLLWYGESDGVIFIEIPCLISGISPLLENQANIHIAFDKT